MGLSVITANDLFLGMEKAELDRILPLFTERKYPKGRVIFERGDSGDALFIVKDGMVKLVSHSGRGTETILHMLPPGAIFGELLFSEDRRTFTALAGKDSEVAALPRRALERLLATVPAFSMNFIRILSRRLAKVEQEYASFGHTWSYHRLARILLRLAGEHGVKAPGGTEIAVRLTHEELANLIGTTRETVTTQLGRFRRMGMARRDGKYLRVNVGRLARFIRGQETPGARGSAAARRKPSRRG
ncbi:MAG: Crp/Fnr family transcriptional regulator [Thermodesulfobacteriota bacterium]